MCKDYHSYAPPPRQFIAVSSLYLYLVRRGSANRRRPKFIVVGESPTNVTPTVGSSANVGKYSTDFNKLYQCRDMRLRIIIIMFCFKLLFFNLYMLL